jgi:hypothetical protein
MKKPEGLFTDDNQKPSRLLLAIPVAHLFGFLPNTRFSKHLVFFFRAEMRFGGFFSGGLTEGAKESRKTSKIGEENEV